MTPAAVTNPQGDSLSVTGVVVGSFNSTYWNAAVSDGFGGYYYENCSQSALGFGGTLLPFCAYVELHDSVTGGTNTTNNTQLQAVYDACGTLVDQQSTYGWHFINTSYISSAYLGSYPSSIPTSGVCWGSWTVVYTFSQTFTNGQNLQESASATFPMYASLSAAIAAKYPQGPPVGGPVGPDEELGGCSGGHPVHGSATGNPVDTASGNFWHTFSDLAIPGRGPALNLTRTYNARTAGVSSRFGYGWIDSYSLSLSVSGRIATAYCDGGAELHFNGNPSGDWSAAAPRVLATLTENADGSWSLVRHAQKTYRFDPVGRLIAITDLNGYTTSLSYPSSTQMLVTDPAGRSLSFTLSGTHVTSVTDSSTPARSLTYGYDTAGNLTDVVDVAGKHWQFSYDTAHRMLTMRSPRYYGDTTTTPSPVVTNHYDSSDRIDWQTDQLGRKTSFDYTTIAGSTMVTDPKGNVRVDEYTSGLLTAVTRGYGTAQAATTYFRYDPATLGQTMVIDPNGHVTSAQFDSRGNPVSRTDALNRTSTFTYNALNEVTSTTEPKQVNGWPITTTMTYDAAGNMLTTSTPLLDSNGATTATATATYHHDDATRPGDVTSVTDPNGNTSVSTYNAYGNLTSMTDAAGDKTTYGYDTGRGLRTSTVSPKGNVSGGNPAAFTTSYAYDAYGKPTVTRDPLWNAATPSQHQTTRHYDVDGNLDSVTDGNTHTTGYLNDAVGQRVAVNRPDGSTLRTDYWPDGSVHVQYDGKNQPTSYLYNSLGQLTSVTDPLSRTTTYGHDLAGQVLTRTDPSGRVTTNTYDEANQLVSTSYSDGLTPNVSNISYDLDGQRTSMTDGTGTSSWTWDSLHRMTSSTDGAGQVTGYQYDIGGRLTVLAYPGSTATVTRGWDTANRLHTVTDWNGRTTTFNYDVNSNLVAQIYPNGTTAASTFDNANRQLGISDAPTAAPASPFATFGYGRDGADLLTSVTSTGVPSDNHSYGYDSANRLTGLDQATPYGYDAADNLTTRPTGVSQAFDAAHQLLASTSSPAISYIGSASAGDATNKVLTLALPTGTTTGDTVVAAVTMDNGKSVTLPAGWASVGSFTSGTTMNSAKVLVYQHAVAAGDTSVTVTFSAKFAKSVALTTYRSAHPAAPIDVTASGSAQSGAAVTVASLTPSAANERLLLITGADGASGTWTAPSGMTSRVQKAGGSTDVAVADQALASSAATGARTATHSGAATQLVGVLVTLRAAQTDYSYDANGNRTRVAALSGASTALTYDQVNRLTGYGAGVTYRYNGSGRRTSKTVAGTTTAFGWDEADSIPLLLTDGTTRYVYGPGGMPVEQVTPTGVQYFHHDGYGSTRLLTDDSGSVVATYTYDPFGNLKGQSGSANTPLRWNGQYQDSESGMYYLRARYYDPVTAQFVCSDPMSALTNSPYGYADNSPLNSADPTGLCSNWNPTCWDWGGIVDTVHAVSGVVTTVAGGCALIAGASVIGNLGVSEVCGAVALGAAGVQATTGIARYAMGREDGVGLAVDVVGLGLGGAGYGLAKGSAKLAANARGFSTLAAESRLLPSLYYSARAGMSEAGSTLTYIGSYLIGVPLTLVGGYFTEQDVMELFAQECGE
ncbi:MAG: RHS repeat-associated core domain-containing protein [Jatrophihabitantaceae bacterium]